MQKQEKVSKDVLTDCTTCTLYPYPCQPLAPPPPPPVPDYPSYGTPPPPLAGYVSSPSQANCPPVPVQCCQHPPSLCLCFIILKEHRHIYSLAQIHLPPLASMFCRWVDGPFSSKSDG
ncbi:hypothetical protein D5086_003219 [Populus alba]|uniref:Uncharacterized protein n=1 Tax=Populus alba TaxID=43335 RepID=A0ACC4D4J3_POPAL